MNIRQLPNEEKPREKLLKEGKEKLAITEILAIIIGSGTGDKSALDLASEIIAMDSSGIRSVSYTHLMRISMMTHRKRLLL